MQVTVWPIDDVHPYEANPRDNAKAVKKVAASIREFGWQQPIVVDAEGVVIAGHTRLLAARDLGLDQVPVVVASDLTPDQARAYRLADNRTHDESRWIAEMLGAELAMLDESGYDLSLTGFDSHEAARAVNSAMRVALNGEDDAPPLPDGVPVCQAGDRWRLGDHFLVCGDATDASAVDSLLRGARPHLMVTDPPYGVSYDADWRRRAGLSSSTSGESVIDNDDRVDWSAAWRLFPGSVAYVWYAARHVIEVAQSLVDTGFSLRAQIIWVKDRFAIGRGHYHWQHEPLAYASRGDDTHFVDMDNFERPEPSSDVSDEEYGSGFYAAREEARWQGSRGESTVWDIPIRDGARCHPTQKPVECMLRPMLNNSKRGDCIYDPFAGSGSGLIAAEKAGRRAYCLELNPKFCDVIIERWQQFSGSSAKLGRLNFSTKARNAS